MTWHQLIVLNLVYTTGGVSLMVAVFWIKMRRLRRSIDALLEEFRSKSPPILIGETFLAERLESIDQHLVELSARVHELEVRNGLNGSPNEA